MNKACCFSPRRAGFTLLEILVASAVFALLMALLLQLTGALSANARRTDDNLAMDADVRTALDLMRRDLAQARIGTNQNVFRGESNRMFFVSSTPRMAANFVSDQRQVVYFLTNGALYRAAVEPAIGEYNDSLWKPMTNTWWSDPRLLETTGNATRSERLLNGVTPYRDDHGNEFAIFTYIRRQSAEVMPSPTDPADPPGGVIVAFSLASPTARRRGITNSADTRTFRYEIELNLPPAYQP